HGALRIGVKPSAIAQKAIKQVMPRIRRTTIREGLLLRTRSIDVIQYLVEQCQQDLNKAYDGVYPLIQYSTLSKVASSRKWAFELIQDILKLGYPLNLDITDDDGKTIKERIAILEEQYKRDHKIYRS
ncbi:MAG: hypothetical protein AAF490_27065, partial [Chloroflexota bacterium]